MGSPLASVLFLEKKESFLDAKALERDCSGGDDQGLTPLSVSASRSLSLFPPGLVQTLSWCAEAS
jgi:hypothetical protein